MRAATVLCRSTLAAAIALALSLLSCKGEESSSLSPDGGAHGKCQVDTSSNPQSATPITGEQATGMACPTGDVDWHAIEVPAGKNLLDLSVGYPGVITRVDLSAQVYAEDGATPVPGAQVIDDRGDDGRSELATTLKIPSPGRYLIAVRDVGDDEKDDLSSYTLKAIPAADPDQNEPNDTKDEARAASGSKAWISYSGDRDVYRVTVPQGSRLVQIELRNPASSRAPLGYKLATDSGEVLAEGSVTSGASLDTLRVTPGPGEYHVTVTGASPDRRADAAYVLSLGTKPELDQNELPVVNDRGETATCLGDCNASYTGGELAFPTKRGQVGTSGDRDFYRFDVASSQAAVLEVTARVQTTPIDLALDLLTPHAASPCTSDSQCAAINVPCRRDEDCELSHACLPEGEYTFCPSGQSCRLCAGASACVPATKDREGPKACAIPQYLAHDTDGGMVVGQGGNTVRTAQPILGPGPVYVVVHDFQDDRFDHGEDYTLDVRITPEPDPGDRDPRTRNNFYNPYPQRSDVLSPHRSRAIDIDARLRAGESITGALSYQADQDWFSFRHPCPGADCGLEFEWVQPGPSPVRVAFLMRRADLGLHESWAHEGTLPSSPVTSVFGDGDCRECSFAFQKHGNGDPEYRYYLQVRDVGMDDWDASARGTYRFRLLPPKPGCPASCSSHPSGECGCFCSSTMSCPGGAL
ncbi:MAG: PPC domain-containing protein [Deltaproteobacteria bacterium]|nr:PPC domain-containing protein [Deltaproteobacteria bacterium]